MNIYSAVLGVMSDIGAIGKDNRNAQQGFQYRGIDDVMNALQPLLIKHKVFVMPSVIEHVREERTTKSGANMIYSILTINYKFYADDGSFIETVVIGEGMDSGDKASNKAMSVAFKYACFQVFCIPTEEMKDPDSETPPESEPDSTKRSNSYSTINTSNANSNDKRDDMSRNTQSNNTTKCSQCNAPITPAEQAWSKKHYDKELCRTCQKTAEKKAS